MEVKLIVNSGKNKGKEIPLPGQQFLIGRGESCHLRPASERISRKHCAIIVSEGRVSIRDLKSTNGTIVNNERISEEKELKNGDKINVGGVIEFEIQFTVAVGGKKSPKVSSIQEAAVRTVEKATSDDLDITQWLDDESPKKPSSSNNIELKNTSVDQNMADTTTILLPQKPEEKAKEKKEKEKEKEKTPVKIIGQSDRSKKPTAANSGDAADNMLRQFFGRKR
jgi:pSer/pThr/pTyr-binding forkhead associated (FHA) protein